MEDGVRAGERSLERFGVEHVDRYVFDVEALERLGLSLVGRADFISTTREGPDDVGAGPTAGAGRSCACSRCGRRSP